MKKAKKLPTYCVFCKVRLGLPVVLLIFDVFLLLQNNNETEAVYTSHVLKDPSGRVVCPALYVYVCPICHNTGHQAHTVKHCPYNPEQLRKQTELAEIWKAYRETRPSESPGQMSDLRQPLNPLTLTRPVQLQQLQLQHQQQQHHQHLHQPLSGSSGHNCRLGSPPALSTPSSSPLMSPNSSGYFSSQPSSPDFSCFSSPTRPAQDLRTGDNSILMENLIKLLHISN